MAQIPNLNNAPLNLTALRSSAKPSHSFTTPFHSIVYLIILMYACREQSQKDLINILKSVRFFYIFIASPSYFSSLLFILRNLSNFITYQIQGKKCLVIDPKLAGTLSLVLPTSLLKVRKGVLRHQHYIHLLIN
jgi:hypothetical protein